MTLTNKAELIIQDLIDPEVMDGTYLITLTLKDGKSTVDYAIKVIIYDEPQDV